MTDKKMNNKTEKLSKLIKEELDVSERQQRDFDGILKSTYPLGLDDMDYKESKIYDCAYQDGVTAALEDVQRAIKEVLVNKRNTK